MTTGLGVASKVVFKGKAKFPGIFESAKLDARFKPFTYSNKKAKTVLGWHPKISIANAIAESAAFEKVEAMQRRIAS